MSNISELIISGLMSKGVDSHRVQELVMNRFGEMNAMRVALYLNGTINQPTPEEICVTLTGDAAKSIGYRDKAYKNVVITGVSYDFWEDRLKFKATFEKAYYFKSQEEADEYAKSGKCTGGSYYKRDEFIYESWYLSDDESHCEWETWQNAVSQQNSVKYDLCA